MIFYKFAQLQGILTWDRWTQKKYMDELMGYESLKLNIKLVDVPFSYWIQSIHFMRLETGSMIPRRFNRPVAIDSLYKTQNNLSTFMDILQNSLISSKSIVLTCKKQRYTQTYKKIIFLYFSFILINQWYGNTISVLNLVILKGGGISERLSSLFKSDLL